VALSDEQVNLANKLKREIDRAEKPHKQRVSKYHKLDDVYDAVLKATEDKWRHDLHPPFALQLVETVVSAIVEEPADPVVKPLTPKDRDVAPKWETLLEQQQDKDHFVEKWPEFVRWGLKRGIAVAKVSWRQEWVETMQRKFDAVPGNMMQEAEPSWIKNLAFDQPSFVVVDQEDFWWNPDAKSPEDIDVAYFRTWETKKALEAAEIYDHLDELTNTGGATTGTNASNDEGENSRDEVLKAGPIEIIERWTRDRLVVIADRKVVIRDERNPFGHGLIPFVYARPIPRNGHVVGKSLCELIADEQVALWILGNQRLDNTELMCNAVMSITNADDRLLDQIGDRFPGAKTTLDPGQAIQWDVPNTSIIEPALAAEDRLMQNMKDQTGAVDYVSGAGTGNVDDQTATEVTLMQSGAQRRLMAFKQQFANARNRAGQQQIELNKRLLTKPEILVNLSAGEWDHESLEPYEIASSNCVYQVRDVLDSMDQQTKRMEASLMLQTLMSASGLMPGQINLVEAIENFSEAYGYDRNAFLVDPQAAPQSAPPMLGGLAPQGNMGLGQAAPPTTPPGAGSAATPPFGEAAA
jgi:hypothetical protein